MAPSPGELTLRGRHSGGDPDAPGRQCGTGVGAGAPAMTALTPPTSTPATPPGADPELRTRAAAVRLYLVTDAGADAAATLGVVRAACEGGAEAVQLRRKGDHGLDDLRLADRCRAVTAAAGILFVVNDRLDIAMAVGADGVHLGQDDLPVAVARRLWPGGLIGRSTHSLAQARAAVIEGADWIGVGPVFATPTKPGRAAVGLDLVAAVAGEVDIPWVAIGGIELGTIDRVTAAGARAVAVVRAVTGVGDAAAACRALRARLVAAAA